MTTLQTVLAIIGSALGILVIIVGFLKWGFKGINKKLDKKIDDKVKGVNDNINERIDTIEKKIDNLIDNTLELKNQLNEQEKWRLRDNILMFAQILRNTDNIENVSENIFNNIFQDYDKYKSLKGNSFVDGEMEYIKNMHTQKDNFNVNKNHNNNNNHNNHNKRK